MERRAEEHVFGLGLTPGRLAVVHAGLALACVWIVHVLMDVIARATLMSEEAARHTHDVSVVFVTSALLLLFVQHWGGVIERSHVALAERDERYGQLVGAIGVGIYRALPNGIVVSANAPFVRMLGYATLSELAGDRDAAERLADHFATPAFAARIERADGLRGLETEWRRPDGSTVTIRENARAFRAASGPVVYFEGTLEDVTERKQREEGMRQAQKMEAIGRLAGGIAHDFNNVLTALIGHGDLTLRSEALDPRTRRGVLEMVKSAERAAALTRKLLAFSRRQAAEVRVVNLREVVSELEPMLRRVLPEDIAFNVEASTTLSNVKVDRGQMEQALLNLVVNARDAMPNGGGLTIEMRDEEMRPPSMETVEMRPLVRITVRDTGCGIDPDIQQHLFEPFYTTKEEGTGLGLAMVYGIVKQGGGHIDVDSAVGAGTAFHLYLPAVLAAAAAPMTRALATGELWMGTEKILVVEDDDSVRELVQTVLEDAGYGVVTASNGREGLELSRVLGDAVDLVLTDVIMPEMSGREFVERLRQERGGARALFMSGYTSRNVGAPGFVERGSAFLQKPFTPDELTRMVRRVLDGKFDRATQPA